MKTGPMVSLGLSVLLGAAAVFLGRGYMMGNSADASVEATSLQAAPAIAMSNVLVARHDIEPGTALTSEMFETVEWPASAVAPGMLTENVSAETQFYARGLIISGEPILQGKLEAEGFRMTLSAEITPGMRAVSIVVTDDTGVAGFVLPGDRVDVNAYLPVTSDRLQPSMGPDAVRVSADTVAKPILKNVKVLAVDQVFEANLEGARPSNTVTLEVSPNDALVLGVAGQSGELGLSLIGQKEKGTEIAEVVVAPKPVRRTPRRARPKAKKTTVRVINGAEETRVTAPVAADKPTELRPEGAK